MIGNEELIDFADEMVEIADRMVYVLNRYDDETLKPFKKIVQNLINQTDALQMRIQDSEEYDTI